MTKNRNMLNKLLSYLTLALLVVVIILQMISFGGVGYGIGGDTNYDSLDVTDGYKVDGTTVIDGSGNVDAAITSTSGTFSTTLTVSGETQLNTLVQGGSITAINATSSALTAAQVCDSSIITFITTGADPTASTTLPSETALLGDCLDTVGDTKTILFRNINAASASTTALIAGTDIILLMPETTGADVIINGGNSALITFARQAASTTVAIVRELIDAD